MESVESGWNPRVYYTANASFLEDEANAPIAESGFHRYMYLKNYLYHKRCLVSIDIM